MESKWRLNVWELGLVGLSGRLYARLLNTLPNLFVTPGYPRSSPTALIMQLFIPPSGLAESQIQMGFFDGVKPNGPGSPFPYGFNVEPDD